MLRFKSKDIEKRLKERKSKFTPHTYRHIRKIIDRGAEGIDPYALAHLCSDLDCLPTDIVEYLQLTPTQSKNREDQ